jgi:hypothetical protein
MQLGSVVCVLHFTKTGTQEFLNAGMSDLFNTPHRRLSDPPAPLSANV